MNYWLLKSEPDVWSIDQQIKSGEKGSIVINQAKRYDGFNPSEEFIPRSSAINPDLYAILLAEKPVIHTLGE